MHGQVSSVLMVLGLLQANALEAKEPVFELRPSSPWNVNWADNYCVLQRMFGKADEGVLLRFMSFTPDPFYQIQLTGELADMNRPRREISFAFTPFASDDDVAMAATVKGLDKSYPSLMFGTRIASDTEELSRMSRQAQDRAHEGGKEERASNERPIASEVQALNIDLGARKLTFERVVWTSHSLRSGNAPTTSSSNGASMPNCKDRSSRRPRSREQRTSSASSTPILSNSSLVRGRRDAST